MTSHQEVNSQRSGGRLAAVLFQNVRDKPEADFCEAGEVQQFFTYKMQLLLLLLCRFRCWLTSG